VETFFEEHGDEVVTIVLRTVDRYESQPLDAGNICTGPKWGSGS